MSFKERFNKEFGPRMLVLLIIAILMSAILIWRLYYVQMLDRGEYTEEMKKQIIRPVRIPPVRGRIEASKGEILANNEPSFSLDFYLPEYRRPGVSKYWTAAENVTVFVKEIETMIHHKAKLRTSTIEKALRRREKDLGISLQKKAKDKAAYEKQQQENELLRRNKVEKILVFDSVLPGLVDQVKNISLPESLVWEDNQLFCFLNKIPVEEGLGSYSRTAQFLIQELDALCLAMGRSHDIKPDDVVRHLYRKPALPFRGLTDLSLKERSVLAGRKTKRYQVVMTPKRVYQNNLAFSHITGYTGRREPSTHDDIDEYFYFTPELWGRTGLEYAYDQVLAGKGGKELLYVNRTGFAVDQVKSLEGTESLIPAKHGENLRLTIDAEAQKIAYDLMKDKRGSMVVMDIYTGAILAMVSTPSFDLSRIREVDYYRQTVSDDPSLAWVQLARPMHNRAVQAAYMPGSIIKPLVAGLALERGLIDEESVYDCDGAYHLGSRSRIRCANRWGHGKINVTKALEVSCNPFFIDLAVRLGMEDLVGFYQRVGFGTMPIFEEGVHKRLSYESKGTLADVEIHNRVGELAYLGIGQGKIEISPVQACAFVAAIANGGKLIKPYIVDEVWDSREEVLLSKHKNYFRGDLNLSKKTMDLITQGMYDVIHGSNASAKTAKTQEGITLAGKTGTAQVPYYEKNEAGKTKLGPDGKAIRKIQKNCWFASFGPYESPRYATIVLVEDGESGGTSAAPVVRKFFDTWSQTKPNSSN
ncbi:penicillin-binding transpeptidase domain-containing protein [Lentisphaera marina]|uniref:peptidoglycan D,D-transpeptidase FtsI family protein n=1 Tax=Lentisphaera marina TaxID=1111041 RepID=UPI0023672FD7|nr:penicillin-binding transpeptidase domain-containing protein [Lentisphaera marina]MDD7983352.1 penicillin-binding transpeptidase domain-containing protein [Lentisphaera marina]